MFLFAKNAVIYFLQIIEETKYEGVLKTNNKVTVKVVKGDITCFKGDVIVNPTNEQLDLFNEGVSGHIIRKGQ